MADSVNLFRQPPWPAPAKLNRFLRIISRRADGYHNLQTIFQFLDRCDYLNFAVRDDGIIRRCNELTGISANDDLIIRAAHLLQTYGRSSFGADIQVQKNLPLGAGLGGGSSDAATTLVALNHYWNTQLSPTELATLGLQLGADVPVFIYGQAAWAEGIGEQLSPVVVDEPWFVVIIPACQIATAAVFNHPDLTRDSEPSKMRASISTSDGNDCEAVVLRLYPEVAAAHSWLSRYAHTRLTGTGACVFAAFTKREQAQQVLAEMPVSWSGFISAGCNHSHLQKRLQHERIE